MSESYRVQVRVRVIHETLPEDLTAGAEVEMEADSPQLAAVGALMEAQTPLAASLAVDQADLIGMMLSRVKVLAKGLRL